MVSSYWSVNRALFGAFTRACAGGAAGGSVVRASVTLRTIAVRPLWEYPATGRRCRDLE